MPLTDAETNGSAPAEPGPVTGSETSAPTPAPDERGPVPYDRFAAVVAERNQLRKEAEEVAAKVAAADGVARELEGARMEAARLRAAVSAGLPVTMADRLKGATVEELAADAAQLAEWARSAGATAAPGVPPPVAGGGHTEMDLGRMSPAQIREHEAVLWEHVNRRKA